MSTIYYLDWQEVDINWEDLDLDWEDVYIILEAKQKAGGGGAAGGILLKEYIKNNPWKNFRRDLGEEKTEKFIKLFCKINGMDYEEVIKPKSKIKVKVEHFERVFGKVPNIKVKM
jgi:hypothetical protein